MESSELTFGPFRLVPERRQLLEGEAPVRLGRRALSILIALAERAGTLVSKEELTALAWPDVSVEEGSLRVHIAALRKVLGDGQAGRRYIENVPGRGYRLVAVVERQTRAPSSSPPPIISEPLWEFPALLVRVVGRGAFVEALLERVAERRFATIVAPGGMGKTTVALVAAERSAHSYEHGARFVDLASLTEPSLAASALASALAPATGVALRPAQIHHFLSDKRMLLVFDNCEHVASAVAPLIEGVLRAAPGVHVIATSREALRAEGESILRLPSLEMPASSTTPSAKTALTFAAVQLFVQHASTGVEEFLLSDSEAPIVVELCRRLDGNPLAIELAASGAGIVGVGELAAKLVAALSLDPGGRRTAPARQRTLHATLDWSHETLSEPERVLLRRLSVFRGNFVLESTTAVAVGAPLESNDVLEAALGLLDKSLLVADASGDQVLYRFLETTHAYAAEKLVAAGEHAALARRHAEYHRDLFERAEQELQPQAAWHRLHGWRTDEVRAALDWSLGPNGDAKLGVALAASTIPLWFQACLLDEYRAYVERALEVGRETSSLDPQRETHLTLALGHLLLHTSGLSRESLALIEHALELCEGLGARLRMRALWSAWFFQMAFADYRAALRYAEAFGRLCCAASDPAANAAYDRMMSLTRHYLGQPQLARAHFERVLREPVNVPMGPYTAASHVDLSVSMRATLACTLWLQGFPKQALELAAESVERAEQLHSSTSLCHALVYGACPVAFWTGSHALAMRWVSLLVSEAKRASLLYWSAWGCKFEAALSLCEQTGLLGLERPPASVAINQAEVFGTLHEELLDAATIERAETGAIEWCVAEIIRARGSLLLRQAGEGSQAEAEALFSASLERARAQGMLSWELRAATSLARLWLGQGRVGDASDVLAPVLQRFDEGFETADLVEARRLLSALAPTQ
jgi:predicted ATPase/DNA-binding winged helix-turn-helix (wHTH) protein